MKKALFTSLFLLITISTHSRDVCPTSQTPENTSIETPCVQLDSPVLFEKSWGKELRDFFWLTSEIEKTKDIVQYQTNDFAEVLRFYRDNLQSKTGKTLNRVKNLEEDFTLLYELQKQIRLTKRKLNLCYKNLCGAQRRVELEDELRKIQGSQTELIYKNPLLSTKTIENFFLYYPQSVEVARNNKFDSFFTIVKQTATDTFGDSESNLDFLESDEPRFDNTVLKNLFINSSIEALKNLEPLKSDLSKFFYDKDMPLFKKNNSDYIKSYLESFHGKFPYLSETLLFKAEVNNEKSQLLCRLDKNLAAKKLREKTLNTAVDGALLIGPLFLGPLGRIGSAGIRSILTTRLGSFGMRIGHAEKALMASRLSSEGIFLKHANQKVNAKENECAQDALEFYLKTNEANFERQRICSEELASLRLEESLSWISLSGIELIPQLEKRFKYLRAAVVEKRSLRPEETLASALESFGKQKNHFAIEVKAHDNSYYTVMDLNKLSEVKNENLKSLPSDYWKFVGDVYRTRLNLTPDEIKGFVKTSEEMHSRTKIILNTTSSQVSSKNPAQFNGGIGIVESKKMDDLLPIEKSTGKRFPRKSGEKSVEIVRLTVSKDAEKSDLSKHLTESALQLINNDPLVTKAYIYTSKSHAVLYRRMGIPKDAIKALDDRDVYIELDRTDLENLVRSKSQLAK